MTIARIKSVGKQVVALSFAAVATFGAASLSHAEEGPTTNQAESLDELLDLVSQRRLVESRVNRQREQEFLSDKSQQQRRLAEARAERKRERERSNKLENDFEENERQIGLLQEQYENRLGSLRELFGVLQQVAGDMRGLFEASVVSAEYPDRTEWLTNFAQKMGNTTQLASIEEMEELWARLQKEMTETGKVTKFTGTVVQTDGQQKETEVVRIGAFNLVADSQYIRYDSKQAAMVQMPRQPEARFSNTAATLYGAGASETVAFAVDPTRGSLLALLIQKATLSDQVGTPFNFATEGCYLPFCDGQGGYVGSIIIIVGIIGVLLAIERLITLTLVGSKVRSQIKSDTPNEGNPLGRILKVYHDNKDVDVETLELKISEAILSETPRLTRNITLIQVISVVSPLMGLLGTVTGMIQTFQAITLFGAGDPKTMAAGISTALMTTVLGLCAAIPTVLLHAIVNSRSRSIIHVLEEQSAGMIAEHAERSGQTLGN